MNWLHYLVEANIYLGVFYLCYCLFLNNETHYVWGRAYLLFSCLVSFILPVTQLSVLKPIEQLTLQPVVYTRPVNYGPLPEITIDEPVAQITVGDVLFYAYIAGAVITLMVLFYRLYRLSLLTRKSKAMYGDKYKLIQLNGDNTAFSFFNYLFIGTEVPQADTIIAHELVHIRQRHSVDIIFVEMLKVLSWFSPFIYLLQRSLRTIHEYIADEQTAAQERDALTYSSFLLNNAYGIQGSPIAHSFFNYNLLKKRIIMLNQKRSGRLARLKYLAAVPLCIGMLCASTLVFSKDYAFIDLAPATPAQAEISIDEPIAKTIKYFKIIDKAKDITAYSDNLSFTDKGIKREFFAKSVTTADIDYIQKSMKLTVVVIDVDSQTKMPVVAANNAKSDTAFAVSPSAKFGDGYTLQENGYLIDKKTPYITVTIADKSGAEKTYNSTNATAAERTMLKDKYGFEFKKEEMMSFLKMASQSDKAFSNNPLLPPPPPPVPVKDPYYKLAQFISQAIEYPKTAVNQKIKVALIANFTLGSDGHISNVLVTGSDDARFVNALKQGLPKFSYPIKDKSGKKKMGVTFFMLGDKAPAIAASVKNSSEFVGESGVVGMTAVQKKEYYRHLPPPPPPARPKKVGAIKGVKIAPPVVLTDVKPVVTPTITIDAVTTGKPAPKVLIDIKPVVKTVPEITIDPVPAKAPKPAKVKGIKLPPPVVVPDAPAGAYNQDGISDFSKTLARTIRYPTSARNSQAVGRVVLRFNVADNKISDVTVLRGVNDALDAEAKRALVEYHAPLSLKSGTYAVPVAYALSKNGEYIPAAEATSKSQAIALQTTKGQAPRILNEVVIVGYLE
jgi:outer membrane biosynthesis protein TonB